MHHTEPCDDRDKRVPFKYLKFSQNSDVLIAISSRYDLFIYFFDDLNDSQPNKYHICFAFNFSVAEKIFTHSICVTNNIGVCMKELTIVVALISRLTMNSPF